MNIAHEHFPKKLQMVMALSFPAVTASNIAMSDTAFLLISLRPRGEHQPLRDAARRRGGQVLALSPWQIEQLADAPARTALTRAMACPQVIFTSPAAVKAAAALAAFSPPCRTQCLAVGEGTRRALLRAGLQDAIAPARMDSEGLLALPALAGLGAGAQVGLVTAPGGRGEILRQLQARGIGVQRADIYRRKPLPLSARDHARLAQGLNADRLQYLALSSGEAFEHILALLPDTLLSTLREKVGIIAASARLAELARQQGFTVHAIAASARPGDLLAALQHPEN
ncbi:uroporphyrinogen-III synthase [Lysobacteraceae bacterium NML95-0200]|nr:uroporphyrinogen-III synthase [Xanthomonadaceae bacterium NML95-0200]